MTAVGRGGAHERKYWFARGNRQNHAGASHRPMPLRIVHYNEPVLRKKGTTVTKFDAELATFGREMIETMHAAAGIGLAAQQIGRALQFCVVDLRACEAEFSWKLDGARPPLELFMPLVVVNPHVTVARGTSETVDEEGCLSFPKIRGNVARPGAITVKFQDEHGVPHVLACDGLLARCLQHEVDHINGVLFIDRMDKAVRASLDESVKALAKETRLAKNPSP
jgi:peptide deformylase